ncbi:MAG: insulinase family protein [Oscillospiraceae bacterium]|nr:insulinase family protein [Oscillospiraceae bacterium]
MPNINRKKYKDGVYFTQIIDSRYKTNRVSVSLILPLNKNEVTANALVSMLMLKGTKKLPDFTELNKALDSLYGANLDTSVSKIGDYQIINLAISSIDDKFALENEDVTSQCCEILCQTLFEPAFLYDNFSQKEFEVEKQGLIDLINSEINDKRSYALSQTESIMFANEPCGAKVHGYVHEAEKLTLGAVRDAYKNIIKNARAEIFFVGCGDFNKESNALKSRFESSGSFCDFDITYSSQIEEKDVVTHIEKMSVLQSKMVLGLRTHTNPAENCMDMRLAIAIYGGTAFSKLFTNVREKLSLCYYCSAFFMKSKSSVFVNCGVEKENIEKARVEILNQLTAVQNGDFTTELLEQTRLSLINSMRSIGDSPASTEIWYLSRILEGNMKTPEDMINDLALVSFDDVCSAAKKITLDTVYILTSEESNNE